MAFSIVQAVTGEPPPVVPEPPADGKNPAAVVLGRGVLSAA